MKSKKIIIVTVSTVVAIAILWFCFGGKSKSANYVIETAQAVRGAVFDEGSSLKRPHNHHNC